MIKATLKGKANRLSAHLVAGYGGSSAGALRLYNVEQVITGETCELIINRAGHGNGTDMLMSELFENGEGKLYFIEE